MGEVHVGKHCSCRVGAMRSYAKSIALYERTRKHLAGGVSSNVRYASTPVPLFFARGEGARLYDVDGNVHIDYVLGNGPAILGHAPKPVIDAVAASLTDGQLFAAQNPRETELAERLCRLLPSAEVVRFATSGTEAVLMAMRLARAFTGRNRILKFEGHYHGWSDQAYISTRPSLNEAGPADEPVPVAGSPGMPPSVLDDVAVAGWNDLNALAHAFERYPGQIAGVIMEPIMVNGGAILPQPGYLAGVRDLCRAKGALFICDEVITGFRVGLGGAQARLGVSADLSVYAKAVAAGFPLAMVAGRRDVMDILLDKGVMHGGTYNGNVHGGVAGGARRAGARRRRRLPVDGNPGNAADGRIGEPGRAAQIAGAGAGHARDLPDVLHARTGAPELPRVGGLRSRHGDGLPHRPPGRGNPRQPARDLVPLDGARRRRHRRDPGGGRPRDGETGEALNRLE